MSTNQNGAITFEGKLGNIVGIRGKNGKTHVRLFVKPSNPQTEKQIKARVRMTIAGQLSKITPASALVGFKGSKSERRTKFMRNIILNSSADINPGGGGYHATLPPTSLKFSEGQVYPMEVKAEKTSDVIPGVKVTLAENEKTRLTNDGIESIAIVFVWSDIDDVYRSVKIKTQLVDVMDTTGVTDTNLNNKVNIYTIPIAPSASGNRAKYVAAVERIDSEGYSAVAELLMDDSISLGESNYATTFDMGK